ncbi:nucleotidyltransferase domain-containing protein [Candidatus Pacearchaeota archaeon]|nr:nucleotidyltransferase domain-containing protein [Candidatus Pacearchaeota archaeon]
MLLNNKKVLILEQFVLDYDTKKYGRDIAKRLKLNQKTVANMLNELEREDILKYSREGKNKYYFLNKLNPHIREIIKLVEVGRKIRFLEKNSKLKDLFNKLEERASGMVLIFGSYASGKSNDKSDLDVFVIGSIKDIKDLEDLYNIKINIVKSIKNKFDKNEIFINEIIKNHIILKGIEEYIGLAWQA